MNRILDLLPQSEETVVSRVLLLVHQSVDQHFPSAEKATRQFMKTVFSEEAVEKTAGARPDAEALLSTSSTVSANLKGEQTTSDQGEHEIPQPPKGGVKPHNLPPPPVLKNAQAPSKDDKTPTARNESKPMSPSQRPRAKDQGREDSRPEKRSKSRGKKPLVQDHDLDEREKGEDLREIDWTTRITLALFLAGLLLLTYSLFT